MKAFSSSQLQKIERPHTEPLYFVHIYLAGETLYFSDRNFKLNGYDYEAYLFNIPETVESIERLGGYRNISAILSFKNAQFRSNAKLIDFFIANPIAKREMDIFVLYIENGVVPATDTATKLHRVSLGEFQKIEELTFDVQLSSIIHALDHKKIFAQITRETYPAAAPSAIGKFENQIYGPLKGIPCHCIEIGAASTLAADLSQAETSEMQLSEISDPMAFSSSGKVQIGTEFISYTGKLPGVKKILNLTRGQIPKDYKKRTGVFQIIDTYKYLVAGHPMKSISAVYAGDVEVPAADYTVNLNDGGKTTIAFPSRKLLKHFVAHSHGLLIADPFRPTGATFTYDSGMGAQGAAANLKDIDETTFCSVGLTGAVATAKDAYFTVTFPSWTGPEPDAVYACLLCSWSLGFLAGEYFRITAPQSIDIGTQGQSHGLYLFRTKLSSLTPPTTLTARAHTNAGDPVLLQAAVYEMWLELEYNNIESGGESFGWDRFVPLVTCDGEGYQDDGSGTYTGIPNALIENAADVRKHLLVALLGRSASEIGDSFAPMRTVYNNQTLGGYKFAGILSALGGDISGLMESLDQQSCSQLREISGKFELSFSGGQKTDAYGTTDQFTGGTASASSYYPGYPASRAFDDDSAQTAGWVANTTGAGAWIKYDFGAGVQKISVRLKMITKYYGSSPYFSRVKDFIVEGSNDDTHWDFLLGAQHGDNNNWETFDLLNWRPYRYVRIYIATLWTTGFHANIVELELFEKTSTPGSAPSSVLTIDKTIFVETPTFKQTPASDIRNLIRCRFDYDWSGGKNTKLGQFKNQVERKDGAGEYVEDTDLIAVQSGWMAVDVADWRLSQKKAVIPMVALLCNHKVRILDKGDYFTLNDCPVAAWEGLKWKVLEIREIPEKQAFHIRGIQWISA